MESGDVIAVLQEKEHPVFTKKGIDLFVKKKLSLIDALCGCTFYIDHLDGRKLAVVNPPGQVLFPGMWSLGNGSHFIGDLILSLLCVCDAQY